MVTRSVWTNVADGQTENNVFIAYTGGKKAQTFYSVFSRLSIYEIYK